ncbi:MAG: PDZ domain-containing protein [Bacteroidia bacterium]|nr:PDZ domain-containing protein [Bacteroidia bacterium]
MKRTILLAILAIVCIQNMYAQNLKRKGALGIQAESVNDSVLMDYGFEGRSGVVVTKVFPETTAEQLKLKPGDYLFEVNGYKTGTLRDLRDISQSLRVGDPINITYATGRLLKTAKGYVVAKHLESSNAGEVIYDEVKSGDIYLRSIIHKPFGSGKYPVIYFIQGFACASVEIPYLSNQPMQQLIDGWVRAGYMVYRVEKPGVGDSFDSLDCLKINYEEELKGFRNGLKTLKQNRFADTSNIFIFGHALGGITAPLIASENKVRGIMVFGAIIKPWFEYLMISRRKQMLLFGADYAQAEKSVRELTPVYYAWLVEGLSLEELREDPRFHDILTSEENPLQIGSNGTIYGRHPSFYASLNKQEVVEAWKSCGTPVLTMHGEYDIQSIDEDAGKEIAEIVNFYKPNTATFRVMKGTEQNFVKVPSVNEYFKMLRDGRYNPDYTAQNFNKEILKYTLDFVKLHRKL